MQADKGGLSPPPWGFSAFGGFYLWLLSANSRTCYYRLLGITSRIRFRRAPGKYILITLAVSRRSLHYLSKVNSMPPLDFPSEEDWKRIYQQSLCSSFYAQLDPLLESLDVGGGILNFTKAIEIKELVWQLHYREVDITKSFILLRYYFEKGIPDDEWYKSP